MATERLFIDDGFTLEGEVARKPGHWPQLRFTYRPAPPRAVYEYRAADRNDPAKVEEAAAKLVSSCLVSWEAGAGVEPSQANVKRLHFRVLDQMLDIVTGYGPDAQEKDQKNSSQG